MKLSILFTICRVVVSLMLFWAITNHSYNYYSFLKVAVFLVGIWGLVKAVKEKESFLMLFNFILIVLFFPKSFWHLEKSTWIFIDIVAGFLLLISIFILDSNPIDKFLDGAFGKKLVSGFSVLFGLGLILFGIFLIYSSTFQLINSLKLKFNGVETSAYINRVEYEIQADENEQGDVSFDEIFNVNYTFKTENGDIYTGSSQTSNNPVESAEDFRNSKTYIPKDKNEFTLNIIYESGNAENNRAIDDRNNLVNDILSFVLVTGFGLIPVFSGVSTFRKEFKLLLSK